MSDILPCPFCGSELAPRLQTTEDIGLHTDIIEAFGILIICDAAHLFGGCGSTSGVWETEHEAVMAWNRRKPEITEYVRDKRLREIAAEISKKMRGND